MTTVGEGGFSVTLRSNRVGGNAPLIIEVSNCQTFQEWEIEQRGWNRCLEAIRSSLRNWPDAGGDEVVMKEIERIRAIR